MRLLGKFYISKGAAVLIALSWCAIAAAFVWLALNAATIKNLHRTDVIACRFLTTDAGIRVQQSKNTKDTTLTAERQFLRSADAFLILFKQALKKKPSAGLEVFRQYVQAERSLVASLRDGTLANVTLSNTLASVGMKLADKLHC